VRDRRKTTPIRLPGRRGLLITMLLVLIAIEVATVTAVVMSQRVRTEEALALHTRQLLQGVVDATRENALKFLTQAQSVVQLTQRLFASGLLSLDRPAELEQYFFDQLALVPQMDGIYFAGPNGEFFFTKRSSSGSVSHYETKIIDRPDGVRRARKIWRDEQYKEIERKVLADDAYDPRVRPWYVEAKTSAELIWSDPYIFFTSGAPGLTAAARVIDEAGKLVGIAGIDVELGAISDFLATEPVTAHGGAAVLVHRNGDVLAYPSRGKLQIPEGDRFRLARLDELDPVTSQAAKKLRTRHPDLTTFEGSHFDSFTVDGQPIVAMFVPFSDEQQWPWLMGVYAPEQNFSGTIRAGQQQALVLAIATSIVIILAAFALSPALIRLLTAQQERATRDPLSSLLNRRSFEELAARPFDDAKRGTLALSVIMVDIDHFKRVNKKFGRQVGDEIIVAVAGRIQQVLSATDMVARYGGEEFAILLSSANIEEGSSVAERVRGAVENAPIGTSAGPVAVTVSLGVAAFSADVKTVLDLFGIAEYLMREAKRNGRNCVVSQPARGTGA